MQKTTKNTIILEDVDSSNNYARRLIDEEQPGHGTVVLAYCQNSGRGHAGNLWESEAKKNLLVSFILYPEFLPAGKQFYLSKIMSIALAGLLKEELKSSAVSIKWPNDIYVGHKKLGGILIENSVAGNYLHSSVVGVGLNLNQENFSGELPNPVSLKQLTQKEYSPEKILDRLKVNFFDWYSHLESRQLTLIDTAYLNELYRYNLWAGYKKGGHVFEACIIGIGEYGQLVLEHRNGEIREYQFKEIEFII